MERTNGRQPRIRKIIVMTMLSLLIGMVTIGIMTPAGAEDMRTAKPGTWYQFRVDGLDIEPFSLSITQNGVKYSKTWHKEDWRSIESMEEAKKGGGSTRVIWSKNLVSDEYTYITRYDGDPEMLLRFAEYPENTMFFRFLVTEASGNNVTVSLKGVENGTDTTKSFDIPTDPMSLAEMKFTTYFGGWGLWHVDTPEGESVNGVPQGGKLLIYGMGFEDKVSLEITKDEKVVKEHELTANSYLAYYEWSIPKDATIGSYKVAMSGTDLNGNDTELSDNIYVGKEPKHKEYHDPIISMPGWLIPIPLVIAMVGLVLLFSRIKRNKLFNNLARRRIYEHIKANPGTHYRAILKALDLKMGTLTHHLNVLEREEHIRSYQDGVYRRFHMPGNRPTLKVMLSNIQERIMNIVKENPGISQSRISKAVGSNKFVVNYHIKILRDVGMISVQKEGRVSQCYATS